MKKKLALLMAAIMTVAMVPVTAFASTKLKAVDEITTAVDEEFKSRVELKKDDSQVNIEGTQFDVYATLTNGKFTHVDPDDDDSDYTMDEYDYGSGRVAYDKDEEETAGIIDVEVISATKAKITLDADTFNQNASGTPAGKACVLPIFAKAVDEGDVTVKFTSNVTAFKTASEVIATAVGGDAEIEIDGVKTFVEDASETIKELKEITINGLSNGAIEDTITLKLKGNYTFSDEDNEGNPVGDPVVELLNDTFDGTAKIEDDDTIEIKFTTAPKAGQLAKITISNIYVKADKKCDAGDVATITVSSDDFSSVKLEVAKMVEEAVTYSVEDDDLPVIWAGANNDEENTLEISVEENNGDILNTSRKATFTFPEGIEVVDIADKKGLNGTPAFKYEIDENVVTIYNYQKSGSESNKTDFSMTFTINAAPTFSGDVDVTLGGQFDDVSLKVATVKAPYTVEAKTTDVLIDYRYVPVNNIVITEAEDGIFEDDDVILLAVEKMDFEDAGDLEVTEGDIDADVDIEDDNDKYDVLKITVKDASTEASTMTISGLELYLDRTLPVGGYALKNIAALDNNGEVDPDECNILWENSSTDKDVYDDETAGAGIFKYKELTINDEYVNVITAARDQDDSMTTKKIIITVGATTMTAGTETVTLDAPAYINAENYTMLPLRAITEAFGATVNWDDATRTVTILRDRKSVV